MRPEVNRFLAMRDAGIVVFPNPGDGRWIAYMYKPGEEFGRGVAGDTAEEALAAYAADLEQTLFGDDWASVPGQKTSS